MMDIHTERLHVRDLAESDLPALFRLHTEPLIRRFVGWPPIEGEEDSRRWLLDTIAHNQTQPRFSHNCLILLRETGEPAGWIGFGHPSEGKPFGDLDFGYAVLPEYWGNGYMTEALRGTLEFVFAQPDAVVIQDGPPRPGVPRRLRQAESIFGECEAANPASARVMEKAGMRRVAEFDEVEGDSSESRRKYRYFIDRQTWAALAETPA